MSSSSHAKTILNIKTDKALKKHAQEVAQELGIPLGTAINAFLKQFVREKEITLSAEPLIPTPYLEAILIEAEKEHAREKKLKVMNEQEFLTHLKSL